MVRLLLWRSLTAAEHHGDYRMKVSGLSKMYKEEADEEAAAEDDGAESSTGDSDARAKMAAQGGHVKQGETNRDGKTQGRDSDGAQVAKSGLSGPSKSCVRSCGRADADRRRTMDIARSHVASNSTKESGDDETDVKQTNPKEVVAKRKAHDAGEADADDKSDEKSDEKEEEKSE